MSGWKRGKNAASPWAYRGRDTVGVEDGELVFGELQDQGNMIVVKDRARVPLDVLASLLRDAGWEINR